MKKQQKRKAKKNSIQNVSFPGKASKPAKAPTRRSLMQKIGGGAAIAVLLGGGGWYLVEDVQATIREEDLTRIGQGIPTVVQIHDPQCPRCRALQSEARSAMGDFGNDELIYLVANIRTAEGRQLANAHDVGHVTLLLFDGGGTVRSVLVGNKESDLLERAFRRHIGRSSS